MKFSASPLNAICKPEGRLTLTSGLPVLSPTVSAAGTVYYTPYQGNIVPCWNGVTFINQAVSEVSNVLANSAVGNAGPAACANNSNYDLFGWMNAGVFTLTRGPLWTSDTGRGSGAGTTQLSMVQGILVNTVAITNGPAAGFGIYLGTIRTNGSATVDWITHATAASGGGAASLGVWNAYNRRSFRPRVIDSNASWVASSSTPGPMDPAGTGSGLNFRISFIQGLAEDETEATLATRVDSPGVAASFGIIGIGFDVTNGIYANSNDGVSLDTLATAALKSTQVARAVTVGLLGWHFFQALQVGDNSNNATYYGAPYGMFTGVVWA